MDINTLTDLYHHMEWADAAVWSAVFASDNAQADTKLRDNLYHLHVVQRAFLRSWRNELSDMTFPTFDDAQSSTLKRCATSRRSMTSRRRRRCRWRGRP